MSFSWARQYEPKHPFMRWIDQRLPLPRLVYGAIGGGYPVPRNLNYWWNFGVLAGIFLTIQIVTGIVLAMHYYSSVDGAFNSVNKLIMATLAACTGDLAQYSSMLNTVDRFSDSIDAYRRAIELNPRLGEAWWSLANLKTFRFTEDDVAAMERTLQLDGLKDNDRFHVEFALGKALHDLGRSDEAFAHYAEGNALRRKYHPFDSKQVTRIVDRAVDVFTSDVLSRHDPLSEPGDDCCAATSPLVGGPCGADRHIPGRDQPSDARCALAKRRDRRLVLRRGVGAGDARPGQPDRAGKFPREREAAISNWGQRSDHDSGLVT